VHTYGGRGVSKPGLSKADREAHTIIYMSDTEPTKLPEESDLNKTPIAVEKSSSDQKLHPSSRLNFAKIHTVNWNVKVMNVGKVARESMPRLVAYWRQSLE
jgi:mRNA-degrading endonuclease toxin of MazEF toxin-antitoxin module